MNAIDLLKQDHQRVKILFSKYSSAGEVDINTREDLFQQIEQELFSHTDAEEQLFYPALQSKAPGLVEEALNDHMEMKQILSEMLAYEVDDQEFGKRMKALMEKVQTHFQEEEGPGGVMELAAERLGEESLNDMGRKIQQRKDATEDAA